MDSANHLGEDVLEAYVLHQLSEPELAVAEEHLLCCEACQDALEETDRYIRSMKAATALTPEIERPRPPGQAARAGRILSWTGAIAALVLAAFLIPRQSGEATSVTLSSFRGDEGVGTARAPAGTLLDLAFDPRVEGDSPWRVEIVDPRGRLVWEGSAVRDQGRLTTRVDRALGEGQYWVRLYSSGDLLHEFSLRME